MAENILSLSDFRNAFNKANGKNQMDKQDKYKQLFIHFDDFTKEMELENNWTILTYEKFSTIKKHLRKFDENLSDENLTEQYLIHYVNHLRDSLQMRNSTISKNLSFVRWFFKIERKIEVIIAI